MTRASITLTTFPTVDAARRAAERLVAAQIAACVQILPSITSIYRWQGKVEESAEILMLVKSTVDRRADIERSIRHDHSYDCPEILHIDAAGGAENYLAWLVESTRRSEKGD